MKLPKLQDEPGKSWKSRNLLVKLIIDWSYHTRPKTAEELVPHQRSPGGWHEPGPSTTGRKPAALLQQHLSLEAHIQHA